MVNNIRVLLVDDHECVLVGLQRMLDGQDGIAVVDTAASAVDALNKATVLHPDIILTDVRMPGMDGVLFTRRVKERLKCRIIILTMFEEYISVGMAAGASGYLMKDIKRQDLAEAIRKVHQGHIVIAAAILQMRFHFDPQQMKLVGDTDLVLVDELLGRAADLAPELQEMLVQFAASMSEARAGIG